MTSIMRLDQILEEFIPRLERVGEPVVAGGAVRDVLLGREPRDIDLFLLNQTFDDSTISAVNEALQGMDIVRAESWKSTPYLVTTVRFSAMDIQIMLSPEKSLPHLLTSFDWNVCLFGYKYGASPFGLNPHEVVGEGKYLVLNRVTYPLSTLRRGFRFSERFKMTLSIFDVKRLCGDILRR